MILKSKDNTALYRVISVPIVVFLFLMIQNSGVFAHGWKAPEKEAKIKNPVSFSEESVTRGQESYLDLCSNCHGETARGGNPDKFKGKMAPPDLVKRLKGHSDGDFFWKIQTGKGDMPSFKEDVEPEEIWDIINYIKGIDK